MIDVHRDAFIAFCNTLAREDTADAHLRMLMRQVVASITAVARADGAGDRTGPLLGLQKSARQFVQACLRTPMKRAMPECVDSIMNACANPDFSRAFAESMSSAYHALPASLRASTIPPPHS